MAVTKFLVNDMGLFPEKVFITDDAPEAFRTQIANEISNLNYGIQAEIQFTTDGHDIHEQIKDRLCGHSADYRLQLGEKACR